MRRAPSKSARSVALAVAFCALGVAAGCGRETFDLLPDGVLAMAGSGLSAGVGALSGGSGSGGTVGLGSGGKASAGGNGGRFGMPPGGGSGNFSCLGEGGCPDEVPSGCPKSSPFPFCIPCSEPKDCLAAGEAKFCDPEHKRCVQCVNQFQCGLGDACNPLNQRCAKACDGNHDNCAVDGQRSQCSLGVCVDCIMDTDCTGYNHYCSQSVCVECSEENPCFMGQSCLKGHCVKL
jgi:hypothetical protein